MDHYSCNNDQHLICRVDKWWHVCFEWLMNPAPLEFPPQLELGPCCFMFRQGKLIACLYFWPRTYLTIRAEQLYILLYKYPSKASFKQQSWRGKQSVTKRCNKAVVNLLKGLEDLQIDQGSGPRSPLFYFVVFHEMGGDRAGLWKQLEKWTHSGQQSVSRDRSRRRMWFQPAQLSQQWYRNLCILLFLCTSCMRVRAGGWP